MIELRSDTFSLPSKEMLDSISKAILGDDVYSQDMTVKELESRAAELLGKEDAILMPSGTMANLASILAHCPRGSKVIVGDKSDIYIYEAGGASVCGGVMYEPVPTESDGILKLHNVEKAFPQDQDDPQFALPSLICIENPSNRTGGNILPLSYLEELSLFAKEKKVPLHMDGARIFNASFSMDVPAARIARYADSVQFCLSKGLSAPVGSMVAGTRAFIQKVRRIRKMLGGGMRQAGVIAAPGIVALENMEATLKQDHLKAKMLADQLSMVEEIILQPNVEINMVFFRLRGEYTTNKFISTCSMFGLNIDELEPGVIRAVIHRNISDEDILDTVEIIKRAIPLSMAERSVYG